VSAKPSLIVIAILMAAGFAVLFFPVGGGEVQRAAGDRAEKVPMLDLSDYPETAPKQALRLLFIHHSCGGQLLAAPGPDVGTNSLYQTHPNGGGLRSLLEQNAYEVHEAAYGSRLGENTDIFDWLPKFRRDMESILTCDLQDAHYSDGRRNQIVAFKSCFPNSAFRAEGVPPGDPAGPDLTVWNAKATYSALLDEFRKHPDVLYVCLTAPPLAPRTRPQPLWRRLLDKARGRDYDPVKGARLARELNNWLASENGWLANSKLTNVVVFDYYDILTGEGASDLCAYATGDGYDSHPGREGTVKAANAFVPFLNRAVHRAGLSP